MNNSNNDRISSKGSTKQFFPCVFPDNLVITRTFFHRTSKPLKAAYSRLLYPLASSPPTITFHRMPECLSLSLYMTQTSPHPKPTRFPSPPSHPQSNQQNPTRQYPSHRKKNSKNHPTRNSPIQPSNHRDNLTPRHQLPTRQPQAQHGIVAVCCLSSRLFSGLGRIALLSHHVQSGVPSAEQVMENREQGTGGSVRWL